MDPVHRHRNSDCAGGLLRRHPDWVLFGHEIRVPSDVWVSLCYLNLLHCYSRPFALSWLFAVVNGLDSDNMHQPYLAWLLLNTVPVLIGSLMVTYFEVDFHHQILILNMTIIINFPPLPAHRRGQWNSPSKMLLERHKNPPSSTNQNPGRQSVWCRQFCYRRIGGWQRGAHDSLGRNCCSGTITGQEYHI